MYSVFDFLILKKWSRKDRLSLSYMRISPYVDDVILFYYQITQITSNPP